MQLAKEYKKFQYSKVNARGNSPQKAYGLQYLVDVGLVVKSYNLCEISAPLEGAKIDNEFKVFYADTGLLTSQLEHGTARRVLSGDLSAYKGALAENMVATAFAAEERELYYYHARSGSPDLDFVANLGGSRRSWNASQTTGGRQACATCSPIRRSTVFTLPSSSPTPT